MSQESERTVYLPLEKLERCSACSKTHPHLRLCSACREATYCSAECQTTHWNDGHKQVCGKTDFIDLASFYPILSHAADSCHAHGAKEIHPALTHKIMGKPHLYVFPEDGTAAQVITLGPSIPPTQLNSPTWWSAEDGATEKSRTKLFKRIISEGEVLPICVALSLALLTTMYTTTSAKGSSQRRLRLQYKSSPIADFGVAKGAADVKWQDHLAYFDGDKFWKGQDPKDHYWLWFKTVRGEEIIFDCSLYTFNFCTMNPPQPYLDGIEPGILAGKSWAPGFLFDREVRNNTVGLHSERQRVSVLRNEKLQRAVHNLDIHIGEGRNFHEASDAIWDFIEEFASPYTPLPSVGNVPTSFLFRTCWALEDVFRRRAWTTWPKVALFGIDSDPGEADGDVDERLLKKWTKKYNKRQISREKYDRVARQILKKAAGEV